MIVENRIYQTIVDSTDANNVYYGRADLGVATTDEGWTIYKKNTAGSVVTEMYPIGLTRYPVTDASFKWSERTHYNYSLTPDFTVPTLATVTIASNNSDTTKAKVGNVVTLTIISSEAIRTPSVSIGIGTATVTKGADELHYTAAYTMATGDVAGVVPFSISFMDKGGNLGTPVTALTGGSAVTFDKVAPTMVSATKDLVTQITLTLSELAKASTITKANAGGFVVFQTGTPATTYAVSSIAPWATNDLVVLTVADMTASAGAGVTVAYTAGGNGTVSDTTGNLLATNAVGVVIGAW